MERFAPYLPEITDEDMKLISEPIDVYAQNIYNGRCVRMGADGKPELVERYPGFPRTANGWPITPESLYQRFCVFGTGRSSEPTERHWDNRKSE